MVIENIYNKDFIAGKDEISRRIKALKKELALNGIDYAVILQSSDIFYFTGIVQQGAVIISSDSDDVFLVKKNFQLAKKYSNFPYIQPLTSLKEIKNFVKKDKTAGFEADVVPYGTVKFYSKLIGCSKVVDISNLIKKVREVKSRFEISFIKKAAHQLKILVKELPKRIKSGMRENEVFNEGISILMENGHQGYTKMRGFNQEMFFGHVLSGEKGNVSSYIDAPTNGSGIYPSFPQGSCTDILQKGSLLSVDLVGCFNGYHADQTRAFALGDIDGEFYDYFQKAVEIEHETVDFIKPGITWEDAYFKALSTAKKLHVEDFFMGSEYKVKFVGHGVGVEVNEFPFIAPGFKREFKKNMVFAIEPKLFLKGKGVVGIENTFEVTEKGCEKITDVEDKIFYLRFS